MAGQEENQEFEIKTKCEKSIQTDSLELEQKMVSKMEDMKLPEDPQIIRECLASELEQKIMEIVKDLIHIKNMAVYRAAIDEIYKLLLKLETLDEELNKIVYGDV